MGSRFVSELAFKSRLPPPYAAQIERADDLVMIYWGARAWKLARPEADRVASLVFPYYKKPSEYRWPVKGKDVLIMMDEPQYSADELVYELFSAGANVVHLYGPRIPGQLLTYDPRAARAIP